MRGPGFAWWPEVIEPRQLSDGLFDLADLFATAATIAGARVPDDRYIDAVDQTSFLLAANGESNREVVFYYMGAIGSAMRVAPWKMHRYIVQAASDDGIPGFINGSTLHETAGLYAFNLCLDPGERRPCGIRTAILLDRPLRIQSRHVATFARYPLRW